MWVILNGKLNGQYEVFQFVKYALRYCQKSICKCSSGEGKWRFKKSKVKTTSWPAILCRIPMVSHNAIQQLKTLYHLLDFIISEIFKYKVIYISWWLISCSDFKLKSPACFRAPQMPFSDRISTISQRILDRNETGCMHHLLKYKIHM